MDTNGKITLDYSTNVIEPAVINAINEKYKGKMHAIQLYYPFVNGNGETKNIYDYLLHRDFMLTNFSNGNVSFYDVKTVEPHNNRGERTNFSIGEKCLNEKLTDYFVFVLNNKGYICRYEEVIEHLFEPKFHYKNKDNNFKLISFIDVLKIKREVLDVIY